ncbi:cyclin [Coniochaeta sp. 2T2.1]|nr:cyclin [Coniochaeta sp. 2T2.1]
MLTRSPVQPSPATAASPRSSFHVFHYAPAVSSPHLSPSARAVAAGASLHRRKSSSSLSGTGTGSSSAAVTASPSNCPPPPPKRYVGIDASTQYSPMDSDQVAAEEAAVVPINGSSTASGHEIPSTLVQQPTGPQHDNFSKPAKAVASTSSTAPVSTPLTTGTSAAITHAVSPNKRRNCEAQREGGVEPESIVTGSPKRARAEAAPAKVLPQKYEFCQVEDIVVLIANMLCELIETNDALALKSGHLTRFHSRTPPGISVLDYLHRLAKHATLSPPLLLSMVYYIDRLCISYPDFTINTLTVHRFLITAATVAAKGLSDSFWNNSTYARVGGVRVAELKLLELEFLYRVDWKIVPNPEVLVAYYRGLVERCAGYELEGEDDEDESSGDDLNDDDEVMTADNGAAEEHVEKQPVNGQDAAAQTKANGHA